MSDAYDEARVRVELEGGEPVEALAYVSNRAHPQYAGGLSLERQAEVIARARGPKGPNADYLSTRSRASRRSVCTTRPGAAGRAGARSPARHGAALDGRASDRSSFVSAAPVTRGGSAASRIANSGPSGESR